MASGNAPVTCDDRATHRRNPHVDYPGACNMARRRNCEDLPNVHRIDAGGVAVHSDAWSVCRPCKANIMIQPWALHTINFRKRWNWLPPLPETAYWRGFWTRMCQECQIREYFLLQERLAAGGGPGPAVIGHPEPPDAMGMGSEDPLTPVGIYPYNTCTCVFKFELGDTETICIHHLHAAWEERWESWANRNANRLWLKETILRRGNHLAKATAAEILQRGRAKT